MLTCLEEVELLAELREIEAFIAFAEQQEALPGQQTERERYLDGYREYAKKLREQVSAA